MLAAISVNNIIRLLIFIISSFKVGAGRWHWKRRLSSFPANVFEFLYSPGNRQVHLLTRLPIAWQLAYLPSGVRQQRESASCAESTAVSSSTYILIWPLVRYLHGILNVRVSVCPAVA